MTTEPGTKLSRRYFASLLGLGAVAAAVGASAVAKAAEVVADKAKEGTQVAMEWVDEKGRTVRRVWRATVVTSLYTGKTERVGADAWVITQDAVLEERDG